jgi:hypothetical protein
MITEGNINNYGKYDEMLCLKTTPSASRSYIPVITPILKITKYTFPDAVIISRKHKMAQERPLLTHPSVSKISTTCNQSK